MSTETGRGFFFKEFFTLYPSRRTWRNYAISMYAFRVCSKFVSWYTTVGASRSVWITQYTTTTKSPLSRSERSSNVNQTLFRASMYPSCSGSPCLRLIVFDCARSNGRPARLNAIIVVHFQKFALNCAPFYSERCIYNIVL